MVTSEGLGLKEEGEQGKSAIILVEVCNGTVNTNIPPQQITSRHSCGYYPTLKLRGFEGKPIYPQIDGPPHRRIACSCFFCPTHSPHDNL